MKESTAVAPLYSGRRVWIQPREALYLSSIKRSEKAKKNVSCESPRNCRNMYTLLKIFILFLDNDSSAVSEMSSAGCTGSEGCGTTTETSDEDEEFEKNDVNIKDKETPKGVDEEAEALLGLDEDAEAIVGVDKGTETLVGLDKGAETPMAVDKHARFSWGWTKAQRLSWQWTRAQRFSWGWTRACKFP